MSIIQNSQPQSEHSQSINDWTRGQKIWGATIRPLTAYEWWGKRPEDKGNHEYNSESPVELKPPTYYQWQNKGQGEMGNHEHEFEFLATIRILTAYDG